MNIMIRILETDVRNKKKNNISNVIMLRMFSSQESVSYFKVLRIFQETQQSLHHVAAFFSDVVVKSVAGDCHWKLPLFLSFAPSSLHFGPRTGVVSFSFK